MKAIIRRSIPAAVTATLVAGAAVTIPAVAATDDGGDDTAQASVEEAPDRLGLPGVGHRLGHGLEPGELAERLADELGLDTGTVQDAIDVVRADLLEERLAEAVEDGHLTQEQADELLERAEDGDLPRRHGRRWHGPRGADGPGSAGFTPPIEGADASV